MCFMLSYIIMSHSPLSSRMADFSSTWGPPSEQGGYMLSQVQSLYKSPDMK